MKPNLSQSRNCSVFNNATERGVARVTWWDCDVIDKRLAGIAVEIIATIDVDVHFGQHFTANHHTV